MNEQRRVWIITWIVALLPLLGWWTYGLFDVDEGFYGAVVAEMNRRGEWITPYYNGHPWFEKPILLYWLAKPCLAAFGMWIGPRLPSIIATLGTYLLVAWFVRRHRDAQTARWAVLIMASSLLVVGLGRMMMTDAILALCLAGAFATLYESLVGDRRYRLWSAFLLGLAVLAKGPVGIFLFVPIAAWTYWREPELRAGFKGWWLAGTAILLATIAAWYVPAYFNGREFVQKFLIEQNLNRFTGGDAAHNTPLWSYPIYFPLVLLIGMAPWSVYALKRKPADSLDRFLWVWALVPLIFFSISKAKLPHYILPSCAPLAMLAGSYLRERKCDLPSLRQLAMPLIACVLIAGIVNAAFVYYYSLFHQEVQQLALQVKTSNAPSQDVVTYQLGKQARVPSAPIKVLGIDAKLNETDHPSLVMYLDRVVPAESSLADLLANPNPQWIITRSNRITQADIAEAHKQGRDLTLDTRGEHDLYRLYKLTAAPAQRMRR